MAELRLEELSAATVGVANTMTLKPGQGAFLQPETYQHAEDKLDPSGSWPRVAREGDQVVGYIMGSFDRDNPDEFMRAALWKVHVAADAQREGVGRFLVNALADEARARGFERVTVVWASGDDGPEEFFKRVGFKVVGETPYGENLGALQL